MSKYTVKPGDTFERIAKKVYGTESKAETIRKANPGASLSPGSVINVSDVLSSEIPGFRSPANNPDEVSVEVEGERFRFWDGITINRTIDSFDTMEFDAPFEVDNERFRDIFKPAQYKNAIVYVGGSPLFTGTGVTVLPQLSAEKDTVSFSGYSLPAALNDVTFPASAFPLEFNQQNLLQIAKAAVEPFGFKVEIDGSPGAVFERVAAEPETKALSFLVDLAKQRNFIISNTTRGALLFRKSISPGNPVARLAQGGPPVTSVIPEFKFQEYYSHITGIQPAVIGIAGSQYTVENPHLRGVLRPYTFKVNDATDGDLKTAVEAKAGRMFGNSVAYSVEVTTWRDSNGNLWEPNTTITLVAPRAMIYREYEFVIRSVSFYRTSNSKTALLNIVLPGAYSGKIPRVLPWDA